MSNFQNLLKGLEILNDYGGFGKDLIVDSEENRILVEGITPNQTDYKKLTIDYKWKYQDDTWILDLI